MTNQVMPKWKIDTIEAAIQALQRDKVPITASRIRKRTGPSVSLDEILQHVAAEKFTDRRKWSGRARSATLLAPLRA